MALPTNGRVIIETTAGEIDIELWSKVYSITTSPLSRISNILAGNTENMPKLPSPGDGGFVSSFDAPGYSTDMKVYLGYYDGVIFHRYDAIYRVLANVELTRLKNRPRVLSSDRRQDWNRSRWRVILRRCVDIAYESARN